MKKLIIIILCLSMGSSWLHAQFVYENRTYSPIIKTVILEQSSQILSEPIIYLNSQKKLRLSFDELSEETHRYEYTIIHCEADWTESKLEKDMYIEGFDVQKIEGFANSFNTIQRYVHYSQTIPSNDMEITKSGNYILKVFQEGNPDNVILTRRFYCIDDKAEIAIEVKPSSDAFLMKTHQEVNVKVKGKNSYFFQNPNEDLKVICTQNSREDLKRQLDLRGMMGAYLDYSFSNKNQFEGGNEFRYFDFTSLKFRTQHIARFDYINSENQVYLLPEKDKHNLVYATDKDFNGNFFVRNEYQQDNETYSDYAWVHFTLNKDLNLVNTYYIVGGLNDWRVSEQNKMVFSDGAYRLSLYLKQGVYSYQILSDDGSGILSPAKIEGNHSETNNVYKVWVYYHNFSDDYDELVGFATVEYRK